jgi:transcriptional regulator with XRE-family HTH domain
MSRRSGRTFGARAGSAASRSPNWRSALAKATLANLEKGRGNPTIETLWALATGLSIAFSDLLAQPGVVPSRVVRAGEGPRIEARGASPSPMELRMLDRQERSGLTEIFEMRVPDGGHQDGRPHGPGIVERIFLTHGRMLAGPADEPTVLEPGDFLRYPANSPHVYEALDGPCGGILIVQYPPTGTFHPHALDLDPGAAAAGDVPTRPHGPDAHDAGLSAGPRHGRSSDRDA